MVPFLFAAVLTFVLAPVASLATGQAVDIIWEYTLNPSPPDDVGGPLSLVVPPDGGLLVVARDDDRTVLLRFDDDGRGGVTERFREPRIDIGGPLVATRSGRLLSLEQTLIRDDLGELASWSGALASWMPTSPYAGPLWRHDYGADGVEWLTFETVVDFGGSALFAIGHYTPPPGCVTNVSFTRFEGDGRVALQRSRDIEELRGDDAALPPGMRAVYAAGSRIIWSGDLARRIRENSGCGVDGDDVADVDTFSYWSLDNSFLEGDLDADVDMAVWNFDEIGNVRWRRQLGGPTTWEYANQVFGLAKGGAVVERTADDDVVRIKANGADRVTVLGPSVGIGTSTPLQTAGTRLHVENQVVFEKGNAPAEEKFWRIGGQADGQLTIATVTDAGSFAESAYLIDRIGAAIVGHRFRIGNVDKLVIDGAGNVHIGGPKSGTRHLVNRPTAVEGDAMMQFLDSLLINKGNNDFGATGAVMRVTKNSVNGRSINAVGTINASGADYAEYETKSPACGVIAKGQIVGFDADGLITDKWIEAISFGVKSTAPSYVGGDTWGRAEALGMAEPEKPDFNRPEYVGPENPLPPTDADGQPILDDPDYLAALAEYDAARAAYDQAVADAKAAHDAAMAQYETDNATFESMLETARQEVDRVAYAGKVPVNVAGAKPGDYVVPIEGADGGIDGKIVATSAVTFDEFRISVGQVRRVLADGRAEIVVRTG